MQKQKIDLILYLVLQNSYNNIQVALFNKEQLLGKKIIDKIYASKDLILNLDILLKENNFSIDDLTFLAANRGPGPFTTLRVVIVTANALNFGGNLPLIGIEGLDAFINEYKDPNFPLTVAILNAYNNDVYFAIQNNVDPIEKGWQNIDKFLNSLKNKFPNQKIRFIGNGTNFFKNEISNIINEFAYIQEPNPQTCSIEQIAKIAYEKWKIKENIVEHINPVYFKEAVNF